MSSIMDIYAFGNTSPTLYAKNIVISSSVTVYFLPDSILALYLHLQIEVFLSLGLSFTFSNNATTQRL